MKDFFKKLKNLLSTRAEITIQIIDQNFNCHPPDPISVEGLLVADEVGKAAKRGSSQGVNLKSEWLNHIKFHDHVKKQLLMDKNGKDFCILLTKPKEEEIAT